MDVQVNHAKHFLSAIGSLSVYLGISLFGLFFIFKILVLYPPSSFISHSYTIEKLLQVLLGYNFILAFIFVSFQLLAFFGAVLVTEVNRESIAPYLFN